MNRFLHNHNPFINFGREHLLVMGFTLALSILLPIAAVNWWTAAQNLFINRLMALHIASSVIIWTIIHISQGQFTHKINLPFDLCNLMALTIPLVMWTPTQLAYEILYFLILGGTLQAILTPDLPEGFPHYTFFKYWTVHSGLVVYIIYITAAFDLRPTWVSIWNAFLAMQAYLIFAFTINYLLGSNYLYIMRKPPQTTVLDYLGPWPWYVLVTDLLSVLLFVILYLPIWLLGL